MTAETTYPIRRTPTGVSRNGNRDQLGLFEKVTEARILYDQEPEPLTEILAGKTRTVQYPLRTIRRQAIAKLKEALEPLEGSDVFVGYCGGSRSHFWVNNVKLGRLQLDMGSSIFQHIPSVIVLWGSRGGSVRIFTECLKDVRIQEYQGYTLYLIDFWNGFGEYPIEPYRPGGCSSIGIRLFKD